MNSFPLVVSLLEETGGIVNSKTSAGHSTCMQFILPDSSLVCKTFNSFFFLDLWYLS